MSFHFFRNPTCVLLLFLLFLLFLLLLVFVVVVVGFCCGYQQRSQIEEGLFGSSVHGEPSQGVRKEVVVDVRHLGLSEAPNAPIEVRCQRELVGFHVEIFFLLYGGRSPKEGLQVSVVVVVVVVFVVVVYIFVLVKWK